MADNTNNGCGLWLFGTIFSALTIGLFAVTSPSDSGTATATSASLVISVVPQTTDAYFVVENNQISYSHTDTLDYPCNYSLVGRVLDLDGKPFTEFVVNIEGTFIEGADPEIGFAFPGEGGYAEDGASGWGSLLPTAPIDYEIWLTTDIGGAELSPHIVVPPQDCDHNEARINFVQVRSFH